VNQAAFAHEFTAANEAVLHVFVPRSGAGMATMASLFSGFPRVSLTGTGNAQSPDEHDHPPSRAITFLCEAFA
jgi:hypothetical protein